MTYEVPVFVTDSALSSDGGQRSGAAIVGTPAAAPSVREPTLCAGARKAITRPVLVAYVAMNPGVTVRTAARVFGLKYKMAGRKLQELVALGNLRTEVADGSRTKLYFSTMKPVVRQRRDHEWPEQRKDIVRRMYPVAPWAEILAALPGKSRSAVSEQARVMGVKRPRNLGRDMGPLTAAARAANERNRGKAPMQVVQVVAPAPAVDVGLVHCAIARMTPLEAAWMGRLAA